MLTPSGGPGVAYGVVDLRLVVGRDANANMAREQQRRSQLGRSVFAPLPLPRDWQQSARPLDMSAAVAAALQRNDGDDDGDVDTAPEITTLWCVLARLRWRSTHPSPFT